MIQIEALCLHIWHTISALFTIDIDKNDIFVVFWKMTNHRLRVDITEENEVAVQVIKFMLVSF